MTPWDYFIVTASNEAQANAYEGQLRARCELGLLPNVRNVLVVPDLEGKRIGSGGSTLRCLLEVLNQELPVCNRDRSDTEAWRDVLKRLRILIVHGGGDSTRLPAYGPCGKVFVPLPGNTDSAMAATLFDRQLPTYLALPSLENGTGQVVITAGDVLLTFDPSEARFAADGVTGLGYLATPEQASKHGVYCSDKEGRVRRFLQKPTPAEQLDERAVDRYGRSILDIGVIGFDAATAVSLLRMCDVRADSDGKLVWTGTMGEAIETRGLDFYREICCAMGDNVTPGQHVAAAQGGGSKWEETLLRRIHGVLSAVPFRVTVLPRCRFLHFGTSRQMITSGIDLVSQDQGISHGDACLCVNTSVTGGGRLTGSSAWVEGCRVRSTLTLGGDNVVVGLDVDEPLELPRGACLDVLCGHGRRGGRVWFIRCYAVNDHLTETVTRGGVFCGRPILAWLETVGAQADDVWDTSLPTGERTPWNARLFPAAAEFQDYRSWLWMFAPETASTAERGTWLFADRYTLAEIAELADLEAFHSRRARLCADGIRRSLHLVFENESGFSAADLSSILARRKDCATWIAELLAEGRSHFGGNGAASAPASFTCSRILHTLGSSLAGVASNGDTLLRELAPGLADSCSPIERAWLEEQGLSFSEDATVRDWSIRAKSRAFEYLGKTIVLSGSRMPKPPKSVLRTDEIIWARAPARLDLGGGWTDTPPYSLEHGGAVINAAVDLNGQPPIQAYARVIQEPVVRLSSIDCGARCEITELDGLLDYGDPGNDFALPKAALALSGLSREAAAWSNGVSLRSMLEEFGGGIELTTLAAVPKGSGLGTSSIMGAVLVAVIQRLMGRTPTRQELFHDVLRLEQALTTGGGWQDQVGGVVEGVKVVTTEPGLVPDARIHFVPASILDPRTNGGQTLLYYTGITRLAKNILQQVVGRYLDRDRAAMRTLRQLHGIPVRVADAMARKDLPAFGRLIDEVWRLNNQLDPGATNAEVETLLTRIKPFACGAKLLGAGGGGFLLIVCKSPEHAARLRTILEAEPPNQRARFFDFDISSHGLTVTVC